MFCNNCGTQVSEDMKFCKHCGASLGEVVVQPQQQQQQQPQPTQQVPPQNPSAVNPTPSKPVEEQAKEKINEFQKKLDNSNSKVLKGKTVLDIVGLIMVAGMILCVFLPWIDIKVSYSSFTFLSQSYSVLNITELSSLSGALAGAMAALDVLFLLPMVYAAMDLLMVKENSSRHIRLIVTAFYNFVLIGFMGSLASMIGSSVSLAAGFYLDCLFTTGLAAVGVAGIIMKNNKEQQERKAII